ncbi:MAG: tetratricopeptide repeat protein [Rhodospirillales bacterium]
MALGFLIAAPQILDAAETENRDSDVRYIYGECLNLQLSSDRTIGACTMAIRSGELEYGETAAAFENRGRAYFKLKLYDKAVADFSEAINISTFNAGALYRRGVVFLSRKNLSKQFQTSRLLSGSTPITTNI